MQMNLYGRCIRRLATLIPLSLVLLGCYGTSLKAQEKSPDKQTQGALILTESHRKILEEADRLAKSGNIPAAIGLLRPLVESTNVEVPMLTKMGELFGASGDFESAVRWYSKAIALAGADADNSPDNLRMRLGEALFQLKKYKEAIPEIEAGWKNSGSPGDDLLTFRMLASAYEETGAFNSALLANEAVLSVYPGSPEAWAAITRIKQSSPKIQGLKDSRASVPAPPTVAEFPDILRLGDPLNWTIEQLREGTATYVKYAHAVKSIGLPLSAENALRIATMMAVRIGDDSLKSNHPADCIKSLSIAEQVLPIKALAPTIQRLAYRDLVIASIKEEQYVHGMAGIEHLLDVPATQEERFQDSRLLALLLQATFTSVSWDTRTDQLRENDPNDFVGVLPPFPFSTSAKSSKSGDRRHNIIRRGSGMPATTPVPDESGGSEAPYGMASPEEDSATIGTRIGIFRKKFDELLMLRIKQKNFELPVKDLLHQLWAVLTPLSAGIDDQYVGALDAAIQESGENVSETTLEAYIVAKRALALFRKSVP